VLSSSHHSKLLAAKYNVHLTLELVKGKVNCSYRHLVIKEKKNPSYSTLRRNIDFGTFRIVNLQFVSKIE
jgi:hypothetical protein